MTQSEGSRLAPSRPRTGCTILLLLARPLCVPIVRAHVGGPLRLPDLGERIEGASAARVRGQVVGLREIGALVRHVRSGMPYTVENELTDLGRCILGVADQAEAWLACSPRGPIPLGSEPAKRAICALANAWDATVLHALAPGPLSLTELSGAIPGLSYPAIERRLSALRATGQVEAQAGSGGRRPYVVSEWGCCAVRPLLAAGRCERGHLAGPAVSPAPTDEAALRLLLPPERTPAAG